MNKGVVTEHQLLQLLGKQNMEFRKLLDVRDAGDLVTDEDIKIAGEQAETILLFNLIMLARGERRLEDM